jgi:hypothetical protein
VKARPHSRLVAAAILALAASCGRAEEAPWRVEERAPPLTDGLTLSPPTEEPVTLARRLAQGDETPYAVRLGYEVRVRAKGMPAMITSVSSQLEVRERVLAASETGTDVSLTVDSASTSMDPTVEDAEEEMAAGFEHAALRVHLDAAGAPVRFVAEAPPGEPVRPATARQERDLIEAWRRLLPSFPTEALSVGDGWRFDAEFDRALPGGDPEHVRLRGTYHFRGMTEWEERELAAIDLDYHVGVTGTSTSDGIRGVVSGNGIGKAFFLVDPDTGRTVRSQVLETTRVEINMSAGTRRHKAEQLSRLAFDLAGMEEG